MNKNEFEVGEIKKYKGYWKPKIGNNDVIYKVRLDLFVNYINVFLVGIVLGLLLAQVLYTFK